MNKKKDLSILARAARMLLAVMMLTTLGAQTARADNPVSVDCSYLYNGTNGWGYYGGTTGGTAIASIDNGNGPTSISSGDDVAAGTEVTLTATPADGYKFVEWEVYGVTLANPFSATTTFTMPNNSVDIFAHFVPSNMLVVRTSATGLGTVQVSLDKTSWDISLVNVAEGTKVYYRFTPNSGYHLENYSISSGGNAVATDNTDNSFVMPNGDVTITADFSALYVTMIPAQGGGTYREVDGTKLYVTPATGYYLKSVTKEGIQQPLESIAPVDGDPYYSVSAGDIITITFHKWGDYDDVRVTFNMKGHGANPGARSLHLNDKVTRPADPTADGYVFRGWFTNSSCTSPYDFDTVLDNSLHYDTSNDRYTLTLYAGWIEEASLSGTCGKVDATAEPPLDGSEVTWAVTKGTGSDDYDVLTISGVGAMADYGDGGAPWYNFRNIIKTIVIDEDVTAIGNYAFFYFVNVSSDITIPASVTSIGMSSFQRVSESTTAGIHISAAEGSALTSIGGKAFNLANASIDLSRCTSLTAISNGLVFRKLTKDVTLPSSLTSICKNAFNIYSEDPFLGDHVYVVVPDGKALSVTITLDEGTESVVLEPTDGKADILDCLYADPANRAASRALTLALVDMLGDNYCTMTGWDGTTRSVFLNRTIPAGKKQTLCLPFAPTALYGLGTVWEFTGIESGKVVMTERTLSTDGALKANTPYIFAATNNLSGILFNDAVITIGDDPKTTKSKKDEYTFTFHGTYTDKTWEATSDEVTQGKIYGFMMQDNDGQQVGQFVKARRRTHLRPFSCWLEYSGELTGTQTSSARRRTAAEELPDVIEIVWQSAEAPGEATGIETVVTSPDPSCRRGSEWYSLDGRRLSGKPSAKGVYINNGKKIVIK